MATNQWTGGGNPLPEWKPGVGYAPTPSAEIPTQIPGYTSAHDPLPEGFINEGAYRPQTTSPTSTTPSTPSPSTSQSTSSQQQQQPAPTYAPQAHNTDNDAKYAAMGWVRLPGGNWVPPNHSLAANAVTGPGGVPLGGGTPGAPTMDELARQKIIEMLMTPQDIDMDELARSPEAAAHRLAGQRTMERNRAILAERNAATGGGPLADSAIMRLSQARGEDESAFMGQLAGQKLEQNRARLEQGIQFALSQGQFEKAQELERELAKLDAAVRREQIRATAGSAEADRSLQRELGLLDLGYRYDSLGANMNQRAAEALLNAAY